MPEAQPEKPISYELYYSSALGTEELASIANQIADEMADDAELTSYPRDLVHEWLQTEPCVIALDNHSKEYLGGVILKRIFNEKGEVICYQMIGLNVAERSRGQGVGGNIFRTALSIADGNPVIVESTNPAVHHLCERSGLQRKRDTQFSDPAWKLRTESYKQIRDDLNRYPQTGKSTLVEVLSGFAVSMARYRWYVSESRES